MLKTTQDASSSDDDDEGFTVINNTDATTPKRLSDEQLFSEALSKMNQGTAEISFARFALTGQNIQAIAEQIQKSKATSLDLSSITSSTTEGYKCVDPHSIGILLHKLAGHKTLQKFNLSNNSFVFNDELTRLVVELIKTTPSLLELHLDGNLISKPKLKLLEAALKENGNLLILNYSTQKGEIKDLCESVTGRPEPTQVVVEIQPETPSWGLTMFNLATSALSFAANLVVEPAKSATEDSATKTTEVDAEQVTTAAATQTAETPATQSALNAWTKRPNI